MAGPAYADFAQSDLEGNWDGYALYTEGWHGWECLDTTIDASGSGQYKALRPSGDTIDGEIAGLDLSEEGIITTTQRPSLHGVLSPDKNIFAYTGTYDGEENDAYALNIHVKTGGSFSQPDLEGTWYGHSITSGNHAGWEHSTLKINENGDATYSAVNSGGGDYEDTATLIIDEDGSVTRPGNDSFHGTMALDKNIFVATETAGENEYILHIFVKGGASFDDFDWTGTQWRGRSLFTGDWQAWESDMHTCSDAEGNGFGAYHDPYPYPADSYIIEPDDLSGEGILTSPSTDGHGVVDQDRNIMIYTDSYPVGDTGERSYQLAFYARAEDPEQQADTESESEGLTEADLSGDYNWLWFGPGEYAMEIDTTTMNLDGAGNWNMELPDDDSYSGTYAIDDQGRLTIEITSPESEAGKITQNGAVGPEGNLIAVPEITEEPGMCLLIKQAENPVNLANQRYNFIDFSDVTTDSLEMGAGYIVFGKSHFTYHEQYNASQGDAADDTNGPFAYSINEDGSIDVPEQDGTGYISPDGNFILFTSPANGEILFLTKSGIVDESEIFGRYHLAGMNYDFSSSESAPDIEAGIFNFDGNGNWKQATADESGTYGTETYGRLLLGGEATYGAISPDGNLVMKPETDGNEIGVSFLVKAPKTSDYSSVANVTSSENATIDKEKTKTSAFTREEIQETYGISDFEPAADACSITADVAGDEPKAEFSYEVKNLSGTASDYQLVKLKNSEEESLKFSYASEGAQANGQWWLTDADGNYVSTAASLDDTKTYTVNFVVEDNSKFDLNTTAGTIKDPTVLGTDSETTSDDSDGTTDDSVSDDDSDSGCFIKTLTR
ncbi:MAG: CFI-box putative sorting motif-containing protein [Thermodesulfobacteriota bacterium]